MSDLSSDTGSPPEKTAPTAQSDAPVRNVSAIQGIADDPAATQAFRDVKSNQAFTEDVKDFQNSPAIAGISDETKQAYFAEKAKKLESDASDQSKVVLDDLKEKNPEKAATFTALDQEYGDNNTGKLRVIDGFTEVPAVKTLQTPETVQRGYGGTADENGPWVTPAHYDSKEAYRKELSVPPANTLKEIDDKELPKGTQVLDGTACGKFGQPGGGRQYYVLGQN